MLDGTVYQALGDGRVIVADDKTAVPYGTVTYFDDDVALELRDVKNRDSFEKILNDEVKKCGDDDPEFHQMNLAKDMSKDIKSAEHDTQANMNKED